MESEIYTRNKFIDENKFICHQNNNREINTDLIMNVLKLMDDL